MPNPAAPRHDDVVRVPGSGNGRHVALAAHTPQNDGVADDLKPRASGSGQLFDKGCPWRSWLKPRENARSPVSLSKRATATMSGRGVRGLRVDQAPDDRDDDNGGRREWCRAVRIDPDIQPDAAGSVGGGSSRSIFIAETVLEQSSRAD